MASGKGLDAFFAVRSNRAAQTAVRKESLMAENKFAWNKAQQLLLGSVDAAANAARHAESKEDAIEALKHVARMVGMTIGSLLETPPEEEPPTKPDSTG